MSATVLALLTAIISVITSGLVPIISYLRERNSHTVIKVTGSDENSIFVKVWNTGRQPSALVGYRLKFDSLPKEKEKTLELIETEQRELSVIVREQKPVTLTLALPTQDRLSTLQGKFQYTSDELRTLRRFRPGDIAATLEIDVQESNNSVETSEQRRDRFRADRIINILDRVLP